MKKDTQPSFFISGSIAFTEVGMINLKGKCAKNMREARVLPNQRHVATSEPVTFNVKQAPRHRPPSLQLHRGLLEHQPNPPYRRYFLRQFFDQPFAFPIFFHFHMVGIIQALPLLHVP